MRDRLRCLARNPNGDRTALMRPLSERSLLLLLLAAVQFTHIMDFMIMMPLGPQLMRELRLMHQNALHPPTHFLSTPNHQLKTEGEYDH